MKQNSQDLKKFKKSIEDFSKKSETKDKLKNKSVPSNSKSVSKQSLNESNKKLKIGSYERRKHYSSLNTRLLKNRINQTTRAQPRDSKIQNSEKSNIKVVKSDSALSSNKQSTRKDKKRLQRKTKKQFEIEINNSQSKKQSAKDRIKELSNIKEEDDFTNAVKADSNKKALAKHIIKEEEEEVFIYNTRSARKDTTVKEEKLSKSNSKSQNARERSRDNEDQIKIKKGKRAPLPAQPSIRTPTKNFIKDRTPSESSESGNKKAKVEIKHETIKEETDEDKSQSSENIKTSKRASETKFSKRPIKHQLGYKADAKEISEEILKIFKNIEDKKKKKADPLNAAKEKLKKMPKFDKTQKKTMPCAKDYNFRLQRNPNIKVEHIIKLSEIDKKGPVRSTDVILAILEIASNADYYVLSYSPKSRYFWDDVITYHELEHIFRSYKGDTLKKYWSMLQGIGDINSVADLVKMHKKFIDSMTIRLLPIIQVIDDFFNGRINDFQEAILNAKTEVNKKELITEAIKDEITGEIKIIESERVVTKQIRKCRFREEEDRVLYNGKRFKGDKILLKDAQQ
jgi:hypothetical protein